MVSSIGNSPSQVSVGQVLKEQSDKTQEQQQKAQQEAQQEVVRQQKLREQQAVTNPQPSDGRKGQNVNITA